MFELELLYIAHRFKVDVRQVRGKFRYLSDPSPVYFLRDSVGTLRALLRIRLNGAAGRYA